MSSRTPVMLCLALATVAAGTVTSCKRSGAPPPVAGLQLAPPDQTRPQLLARVTIPSPDRTVDDMAAIGQHLQLPFGQPELRTMLQARLGLPNELVDQLDTRQAVGVAAVARPNQPTPLIAVAAQARSTAAIAKLTTTLGTRISTQRDAVQIRRPDGSSVWLLSRGTIVLASETLDGLVLAGNHAIEARSRAGEDVLVTVYPAAIARARGAELGPALAGLRAAMAQELRQAEARRGRKPTPAALASLDASTAPLFDRIADTESADLAVDVDRGRGVSVIMRAYPRARSALASELHAWQAIAADPALVAGDAPSAFLTVGPNDTMLQGYPRYLEALAATAASSGSGVKGAAELARALRTLPAVLTGGATARVVLKPEGGSCDLVLPLKATASRTAAFDAFSAAVGDAAWPAFIESMAGRDAPRLRWKRMGDVGRAELHTTAATAADLRRALKAFLGTEIVMAHATTGPGRLVVTTGGDATTRLVALAASSPPAAASAASSPWLSPYLADSQGAAGLLYLDVMSFVRPGLAVAGGKDPGAAQMAMMITAIPGLVDLKLPLIATWYGGDRLSAQVRVPLSTLSSAAAFVRPFIGLGGLGGLGGAR